MANAEFTKLTADEKIIIYSDAALKKEAAVIAEKYGFIYKLSPEKNLAIKQVASQEKYQEISQATSQEKYQEISQATNQDQITSKHNNHETFPGADTPLWFLFLNKKGLQLHYSDNNCKPLLVDFNSAKNIYRRQKASVKSEAIAKAIGLGGANMPRVLDLTAGLGQDALMLASLGCIVTMIERQPVVAALLSNGLARFNAAAANISCRYKIAFLFTEANKILNLINENTEQHLADKNAKQHLASTDKEADINKIIAKDFDAIYLDPMFPENSYKKSAVKKEMKMLQAVVNNGIQNDDKLLELALKTNVRRVVVKRPKGAAPLANIKPHHSKQGRSNRFDIYLNDIF